MNRQQEALLERRVSLMEDYEAISQRLSTITDPVQKRRLERQADALEEEIQELNSKIEAADPPPPSPPPPSAATASLNGSFPFTNREDEIQLLLSSLAPAHYLVDAAAGYGKTKLLKQLQIHFTEREWYAVYLPVNSYDRLTNIAQAVAAQTGISDLYEQQPKLPPGKRLGSALNRYWSGTDKNGIVFLLDLQPDAWPQILPQLRETFIPQVQRSLQTLSFFTAQHNRFRTVIAGRYLASLNMQQVPSTYPANVMRLSPFSYEVIRNSTVSYLSGYDRRSIHQLTAHLFFLTGGHPGCMAETLQLYRDTAVPPEDFVHHYRDNIWADIVRHYTENIDRSIGDNSDVMKKLSVFRYLDYAILTSFVNTHQLHINQYDLADTLTGAFLLDWDGRFLKDDILRRLLAIKLRHQNRGEFEEYCRQAQQFYAVQLTNPRTQGRDRWTVEHLYHALQQHACLISNRQERTKLVARFFAEDLPNTLSMLVEGHDIPQNQWRAEQHAIRQVMENDWEFQFTVNYYLRGKTFTGQPYQKLQREIRQFFSPSRPANFPVS